MRWQRLPRLGNVSPLPQQRRSLPDGFGWWSPMQGAQTPFTQSSELHPAFSRHGAPSLPRVHSTPTPGMSTVGESEQQGTPGGVTPATVQEHCMTLLLIATHAFEQQSAAEVHAPLACTQAPPLSDASTNVASCAPESVRVATTLTSASPASPASVATKGEDGALQPDAAKARISAESFPGPRRRGACRLSPLSGRMASQSG